PAGAGAMRNPEEQTPAPLSGRLFFRVSHHASRAKRGHRPQIRRRDLPPRVLGASAFSALIVAASPLPRCRAFDLTAPRSAAVRLRAAAAHLAAAVATAPRLALRPPIGGPSVRRRARVRSAP